MKILLSSLIFGSIICSVICNTQLRFIGDIFDINDNFNSFSYSLCDVSENTFKLQELIPTPNPPKKGELLSVTLKGNLLEKIDFGSSIEMKIHYSFIKVYDKTLNLCEELEKHSNSIKCPIEKGVVDIKYTTEVSNEMLNGKYKILVKIKQKDTKVLCANIKLQI